MLVFDTICALATANYKSALAIIRLSGNHALDILKVITKKNLSNLKPNSSSFMKLYDEDELIDEAIVTYFKGPKSYTGFDTVEFTTHGSLIIVERLMDTLIKNGARRALKGEFSYQAYMNSKMNLLKAESINDLINANSLQASKLALKAMEGDSSKYLDNIKNELLKDISNFEYLVEDIYIDEENLFQDTIDDVINSLDRINKSLNEELEKLKISNRQYNGYRICLVGKTNVGKSTLLNALAKEEKAIVSSIPGTTRDVIEVTIEIDGVSVTLIDTAGIRKSKNVVENIGIEKAKKEIKKADLILLLSDKGFKKINPELLSLIENKEIIKVSTKSDLNEMHNDDYDIKISALYSSLDELKKMIKEKLNFTKEHSSMFLGQREADYLNVIINLVLDAKKTLVETRIIDISADKIRLIISKINEMKGFDKSQTMEDIYETLFSNFCLGK